MDDVAAFRPAMTAWARESAAAPIPVDVGTLASTVAVAVLVEGESDRVAIEALADLQRRDLSAERLVVLPMNGAMNVRNFVQRLGPAGLRLPLAGLCDIGEERYFRRAQQGAGLGEDLTREDLERLGFFLCDADLEAELIRALGTDGVEQVMAEQGDLRAFRTFQNQPAQRGRAVDAQRRRFLGSIGGRKSRYARALVEALGPDAAPRPLRLLLEYLRTAP